MESICVANWPRRISDLEYEEGPIETLGGCHHFEESGRAALCAGSLTAKHQDDVKICKQRHCIGGIRENVIGHGPTYPSVEVGEAEAEAVGAWS